MSQDTPSRLRHCHRRAIQRSAVRRPVRQVRRRITGARLCILPVRTDNPAQRLRHRHRRTIFSQRLRQRRRQKLGMLKAAGL